MPVCNESNCPNTVHRYGALCTICVQKRVSQGLARLSPQPTDAQIREALKGPADKILPPKDTSSGGDNDYWVAKVTNPKRLAPYEAECEDLIELFQFSFSEGNVFKAMWRLGMDRVAQGKPGDTPLRNAQKVAYYGQRMTVIEQRKLHQVEPAEAATGPVKTS